MQIKIKSKLPTPFLLSALLLFVVSLPAAAQFSQVISIGDSLSDAGNTDDVSLGFAPGSGYFFGRFSNGQVWNELLAIELGLTPPAPSRFGGDNYAYGGALTSMNEQIVIIPFFWVITLPAATNQLFIYLNSVGQAADNNALYTISIGGNDILSAGEALSANANAAEIAAAKQELFNIAQSLYPALAQLLSDIPAGGEGRVVLLNAPNVGVTPRAIADGKQAIFTELSLGFNQGLTTVVNALSDARLLPVDFFALTSDAVANPQAYGFTNVTDRCLDEVTSASCSNPDEYLFWDDIHPTSMGHTLLMLDVHAALTAPTPQNIPIPPAYTWLLLVVISAGRFTAFKS